MTTLVLVAAYQAAIDQGADVIECDMTLTKDKHIVCLHDTNMKTSTDVASLPQFADRKTSYNISNEFFDTTQYELVEDDWFSVDFTLAELKTLKKVQDNALRDPNFNGLYEIATLEEAIHLVKSCNRPVGIHLETKAPRWTNSLPFMTGTTFENLVVEVLRRYGYRGKRQPVFLESFDEESLMRLKALTDLPLVRLLGYPPMNTSDARLKEWAESFYGIGPWKVMIIPGYSLETAYKTQLGKPTDLVERAHKFGLKVHTYTMRNENTYLAWDYNQDPVKEYEMFLNMGVDGYFTDFPETMNRVVDSRYRRSLIG